jgi:hypothetical protein
VVPRVVIEEAVRQYPNRLTQALAEAQHAVRGLQTTFQGFQPASTEAYFAYSATYLGSNRRDSFILFSVLSVPCFGVTLSFKAARLSQIPCVE